MLVGASLSLTGRFQRQGAQAHAGIRLWADYARASPEGGPRRLIVLDDGSRASLAQAHARRLLVDERVDVLVGPYSSGLVLAVAPIAAEAGKALWNHGGTSDAIFEQGWRHVVSVASPASDYLRELPGWIKRRAPQARRVRILHAVSGTFATQVARGGAEGARAAGFTDVRMAAFESPLRDAGAIVQEAADEGPDLLLSVGAFGDDLAVARRQGALPTTTALALVGAGLAAFGDEMGTLAEGILGPSQWEPGAGGTTPEVGPDAGWFVEAFERAFHRAPEYPAAQAFAAGLILAECRRRAGSLENAALLEAARTLETTTFFGGFRLDPSTGKQVGHSVRLVQWRGGRKEVIG